tara:strand:- start:32 stop:313 length:282 start_codon:yes stop_codon:yes gene_type:complete
MKTRLQDLLDKETLKKLTESKSAVKEANPDGTISPDEDRKREKLVKDSVKNLKKLVDDIKRQAYKIGGTFRSPGIRHEVHREIREIVDDLLRK